MVNRPQTTLKKKVAYLVLKNKSVLNFKLRKSSVFKLTGDKNKKELKSFIKKNQLSVKNENDLKMIFTYLDGLK